MENPKDPEWMPYLMGQNAYARSVLSKIPGREDLAGKIGVFTGALTAVSAVQAAGPYVFSEVRPAANRRQHLRNSMCATAPAARTGCCWTRT